jgi:hypothetical protein
MTIDESNLKKKNKSYHSNLVKNIFLKRKKNIAEFSFY